MNAPHSMHVEGVRIIGQRNARSLWIIAQRLCIKV